MTREIVRRLYIYAAAFLGLQLLLAGVRGVLTIVIERLNAATVSQPEQLTASLSLSLAFVICGLPLWAGHWWWAQRSIHIPEERHSALRRLYVYLVLLVAMLSLLFELQAFIGLILAAPTGILAQPLLGTLLINGAVWLYHWHILRTDRLEVEQAGASATLRRWYLIIVQAVSLAIASFSAVALVHALLQLLLTVPIGTDSGVGQALAGLIAGLAIWLPHQLWARSLISRDTSLRPDESRSVLRQVYAALIVTIAAVTALGGLTTMLYGALLVGFGEATWHSTLLDYSQELAVAVIGAVVWWHHRAQLFNEARQSIVPAQIETAQRMIGYLTAAIGMGALFFGLGGLIGTLLQFFITPAELGTGWRDPLSRNLALSIVALPVYSLAARAMERQAHSSTEEEHTPARRIYLYAVLLFGIIATISAIVVLLRLGLGVALGSAEANWTTEFVRWLGYALIGGVIAGLYTLLLRRSGRVRSNFGTGHRIVIIANEPLRDALVTAITHDLPGASLGMVGEDEVTPITEMLTGAEILIVPLRAVLQGAVVPVIQAFPGQRLLLPTATPGYEVIGLQSDEELARAVAHLLRTKVWNKVSEPTTAPAIAGIA